MSPRRKSGLTAEDLQALKHLPAVKLALEHAAEQYAELRRLMGSAPAVVANPPPAVVANPPRAEVRVAAAREPDNDAPPPNPILDTPERREYEQAKRTGKKVVEADPFANVSEAQRARMEEQRAYLRSQGRAVPEPDDAEPAAVALPDDAPVRTEALTTISGDA